MSGQPIEALKAERETLLGLCSGFDKDVWAAPSGCPGWSVQDLVSHMGALFWLVVDASTLPDATGVPTEEAQELYVQSRRSLSPEETLADYELVSTKALESLPVLVEADFEMPLGDLGTYSTSQLPNAFCFDHYAHIRADLFAPRGPLRAEPPPSDGLLIVPVLDWIEAALPQQNRGLIESLDRPVELDVSGVAGRKIRLGPAGDPAATVRSDAPAFVRWVTHRAVWEDVGATAAGSDKHLTAIRGLRVF